MLDRERLRAHLAQLYPTHRLVEMTALGPDTPTGDASTKIAGYGCPVLLTLVGTDGGSLRLVCHTAGSDELGHDRRADRAAAILLAFDDFPRIPAHVKPVDVGAVTAAGALRSLRDCGELYLITEYGDGCVYAQDLRAIARRGANDADLARVDVLARYLANLHEPVVCAGAYRRSIRDLVGSGEGIFGIVDSYPDNVPNASLDRLHAIERRCAEWRWQLRGHEGRLARIHGDFHPFNIVFDDERLVLLDASRGTLGDPADDLTALAINFLLFAIDERDGWKHLGPMWHRFWAAYLEARFDPSLLAVAPPFLAWRALVVCNPRFYPKLAPAARGALLGLIEGALEAHHLNLRWADDLFA